MRLERAGLVLVAVLTACGAPGPSAGGALAAASAPLPATDAPHYLYTYFTGNGETGLHLAHSRDGIHWRALNGGRSFLPPRVGEARLMRDPSIVRGPDGTFHMVWTAGWREQGIGYASSEDLIHWSQQRYLEVMAHEPDARNTWAPELYYDDATGEFLIVWATTIPGRFPEGDVGQDARGEDPGWNHRLYYVTTRDFQTFSEPALFYEHGFSVIDGALFEPDVPRGRYAMVLKDERNEPLEVQKNLRLAFAERAEGPWSPPTEPITGDYWAEGPTPLEIDGRWHIYFDKYIEGEFGLLVSEDLVTWEDWSAELVVPEDMRHGTVFEVPAAVAERLLERDSVLNGPVRIRVDTRDPVGPMTPIWAWFGYDEPNYTYMPKGRKLLSELAEASPVPVYIRAHNLLTSGDGAAALKWGSTNAYTEDEAGRPVYDWTIIDSIFDTYVERGMKPMVEIGFMPEALSSNPEPYRHDWEPGDPYGEIFAGWSYPPTDYEKWQELVYHWVRHSVERYGREEVESWWWGVWNEPDIPYWQGTFEEYLMLYDHAAAGVKRALPTARVGGPHVTPPNPERTQRFLRDFLEHTIRGTNHVTGETGSPLDYVGFHAKGAPRVTDAGHVRMNVGTQLRAIANGFSIIAEFPELEGIPVIIGESDPEGCAACPETTNPENAYRNGTMYSSYTAEQLARTYQLADSLDTNLIGSVTWAFQFEDQPIFYGFRSLASAGVDKPVVNVFRMLGLMSGDRVRVTSTGALPLHEVMWESVRGASDVAALAARDEHSATVLVWNYHDEDIAAEPAAVDLVIEGLPDGAMTLTHYRVDGKHGNAYALWKALGSPRPPTQVQRAELMHAGQLTMLEPPRTLVAQDSRVDLGFTLPRQGVSLVKLAW